MRHLLLLAALISLGGCAAPYADPPLPTDHPANPGAMEAPAPQRSRTLEAAEPGAVPAISGERPMHDAGHDMAGDAQPDNAAKSAPAALYACPMHPMVTSDKPGQRCPKCGMKLQPTPKAGGPK